MVAQGTRFIRGKVAWFGGKTRSTWKYILKRCVEGCVLEGLNCKAEGVAWSMAGVGATLHWFLLGQESNEMKTLL